MIQATVPKQHLLSAIEFQSHTKGSCILNTSNINRTKNCKSSSQIHCPSSLQPVVVSLGPRSWTCIQLIHHQLYAPFRTRISSSTKTAKIWAKHLQGCWHSYLQRP